MAAPATFVQCIRNVAIHFGHFAPRNGVGRVGFSIYSRRTNLITDTYTVTTGQARRESLRFPPTSWNSEALASSVALSSAKLNSITLSHHRFDYTGCP